MDKETKRPAEHVAAPEGVYDYRAGILRSLRGRGGAASLGEVKGDIAGEAGMGVSLQRLENARQALVSDGNLYTDVRPTRDRRGNKKKAVFLVLVGRPSGIRPAIR
jgi:hypothetical protein